MVKLTPPSYAIRPLWPHLPVVATSDKRNLWAAPRETKDSFRKILGDGVRTGLDQIYRRFQNFTQRAGNTIRGRLAPNGPEGDKPADNGLEERAFFAVLLKSLIDKVEPGALFVFSNTGSVVTLNIDTPEGVDPLAFFLEKVLGISDATDGSLSDKEFKTYVQKYGPDVPEDPTEIMLLIMKMLNKWDKQIAVSAGRGNFAAIGLPPLPQGMDPIEAFLSMGSHKPAPSTAKSAQTEDREYSLQEILAPFEDVFLETKILNKALRAVGWRQLVTGRKDPDLLAKIKEQQINFPNGVILTGPPGTGKSAFMEALSTSWARCGGYVHEIHEAKLEEPYVGALGKNLVDQFETAITEARRRGKPALVIIDEASNLAKALDRHSSTQRFYQGGLDALKDYAVKYPELVIILATNADRQELDRALTRSLRLEVIEIAEPTNEERAKMLSHYLEKYGILNKDELTREQLTRLVKVIPHSQGADIRKFAQFFYDRLINAEYARRGLKTDLDIAAWLEAGGTEITKDDVMATLTFERVLEELKVFAETLPPRPTGIKRVGFTR